MCVQVDADVRRVSTPGTDTGVDAGRDRRGYGIYIMFPIMF